MYGAEFNDRVPGIAVDGVALAAQPLTRTPSRLESDVAPLAQFLAAQISAPADPLWIATPALADAAVLGEWLRSLRSAGLAVQGFVDHAAVLAAWLKLSGPAAVINLSRTSLSISLVTNDAAGAALRRTVRLPGGEAALHAAWLNLAATTLIQQTRFDPLHDQGGEAQLRQRLPQLAAEAQQHGQATCAIDAGHGEFELTLTRDQLVAAATAWLQPLGAALQALSAATDDCALLVPRDLLDIPGVTATLAAARFASAFTMDQAVVARAASCLPETGAATSGAVQYLTRVPTLAAAAADALEPLLLRDRAAAVMATHLVYRGRVLPIPSDGLILGRDPGEGGVLQLPEGVAGLSRRHCTLSRDELRAQIVDHSTYGSFIDGVRVRGRALLTAGSTLRLGEPGIELPLVALD